jgi:hypothetical protein
VQDRGATRCAITDNVLDLAVRKHQLIETHYRDVEGSEISPQTGMDPPASIRIQLHDPATNGCSGRNRNPVIDANRIEQARV